MNFFRTQVCQFEDDSANTWQISPLIEKSMKFYNSLKFLSIFTMGLIIASLVKLPEARSSSSPFSGQYSCVINSNWGGWNLVTTLGEETINAMGYFNFDTGTVQTLSNVLLDAGTINPVGILEVNTSRTLRVSSGPITNSYRIEISDASGSTEFIGMPVNSNNSILLTHPDTNAPYVSGICQRI